MNILVADDMDSTAFDWLSERHHVDLRLDLNKDASALRAACYKAEALVPPRELQINRQFLDFAPLLRVIARLSPGSDNIDMEACRDRHVQVVMTNSAATQANAEYLLSGLMMLARPGLAHAAAGVELPSKLPKGRELNACTVGMIGLTPTAVALIPMLRGLGVTPLVYDFAVHPGAPVWSQVKATPVALPELLERSDLVSLQALYAQRYAGILNRRVLAHCKRGQAWVGITRSSIFEPNDLADALEDGRMSVLLLDGPESNFRQPGSRLAKVSQLICTPRIGAHTHDARHKASWMAVRRMDEILRAPPVRSWAAPAPDPIDAAPVPGEEWAETSMVDEGPGTDPSADGGFAETRQM